MTMFNEAKIETLQNIYDQDEVTASDYASTNGLTLQNASTRLRRYSRQGILGRWKEGREYVYYITDRGIERLEWLITRKNEAQAQQTFFEYIANNRCPVKKNTRELDIITDEIHDFDDYESDEESESSDSEEDDYELDEIEQDEDNEVFQLEDDDKIDDLAMAIKNIKRCKVIRQVEETDHSISDEETSQE